MLARWDRPIGTWLLLTPCWWGQVLASPAPDLWLAAMFGLGALAMRGAGCTINDLADRNFDRDVERTRNRPLAAGRVTFWEALIFLAAQLLVGLAVLLQLPVYAQLVALASIPLVVAYPFMKRITYWPQAFLGLTFNWGILVGYASEANGLDLAVTILYCAAVFWTLGYDTIYAHQDKEDDIFVGVKSLAIWLGDATKPWLWGFFGAMVTAIGIAGFLAGKSILFLVMLVPIAGILATQVRLVDLSSSESCLKAFRLHRSIGLLILIALWIGSLRV
ncbi:MAG: 4-hydroxybenzoate octaprenyltransferase [Pseudomonadota bacterium]